MKKLGKLSINVDKIIKNEELVNLRGGYGYGGSGTCMGWAGPGNDVHCGVSRTEAIFWAGCQDIVNGTDCGGGHWCCDSCSDTGWMAECYS